MHPHRLSTSGTFPKSPSVFYSNVEGAHGEISSTVISALTKQLISQEAGRRGLPFAGKKMTCGLSKPEDCWASVSLQMQWMELHQIHDSLANCHCMLWGKAHHKSKPRDTEMEPELGKLWTCQTVNTKPSLNIQNNYFPPHSHRHSMGYILATHSCNSDLNSKWLTWTCLVPNIQNIGAGFLHSVEDRFTETWWMINVGTATAVW